MAAGVLQQCVDEVSLVNALIMQCVTHQEANKYQKSKGISIDISKGIKDSLHTSTDAYESFYADHTGSTVKHLHVLQQWLNSV